MKKIIAAFIFCFLSYECFSQAGMWTCLRNNSPAVFGIQGVPDSLNNPPPVYEPCEWTDLNGNLWLFGGTNGNYENWGDLWKYDISLNMWTWMKGTGILDDTGNTGIMGVASLSNLPSATSWGAASWVDLSGDLWTFGGGGNDTYRMWKYNIASNMWTWMSGTNPFPVHGIQGVPSPSNTPGARQETSATWVDDNGDLWLFGGYSLRNDLWKYDVSTNEWTWMKGPDLIQQPGVYGTLGVPDPLNVPEARQAFCTWKDANGKFWLFGGGGLYPNNIFKFFNDVWMYDPSNNNWTWMSGTNTLNNAGTYGPLCDFAANFCPSARIETRARWVDDYGNFWCYGGGMNPNISSLDKYNDLWCFSPVTLKWSLINGSNLANQAAVYGTIGIPDPSNQPGARFGAVGWKSNGNLYLFGGNPLGPRNDLWKYVIDTTCFSTAVTENNPPEADELLVFPNPTNSSLAISFLSAERQIVELRIYSTLGKEVYFSNEEITKGKFVRKDSFGEKEINVENLRDGIYFLQVKTKEGNISRKIIVSHP